MGWENVHTFEPPIMGLSLFSQITGRFEPDSIDSWEIQKVVYDEMVIQVNFRDPDSISIASIPDDLYIEFINNQLFRSDINNYALEQQVVKLD